jgi:large subunit ribosomal protein L17
MRHRVAGKRLGSDTQHRLAMRRNMARALFMHARITTSMAKAKAIRPFVDKLVTRAKRAYALKDGRTQEERADYIHQIRILRRDIKDREVLKFLVETIAPTVMDRPGGYTRIIRDSKNNLGDNSPQCIWEFVDRPAVPEPEEAAS